ncbi:MAG: SDR family NAD(P)-dependent oxidoreductase [Cyanobacteria bacterium J06631_2]
MPKRLQLQTIIKLDVMSKYLEKFFSLEGRIAIVTHAATELGGAVIRGLANSGAIVCGTDISRTTESQWGENEYYIRCNLNHFPQFQLLCEEIYRQHSQLNILLNVAEISTPGSDIQGNRLDNFRQEIESQLQTAVHASRTAAQYILQSGGGSIINIISIKNAMGFPDDFSYIATKNALLMMTKKLAVDLIKDNIRVNNIVIGYSQGLTASEKPAQLDNHHWKDLVGTVIYLASESSDSMTGQDIFIIGDRVLSSSLQQ